MPIIFLAPPSSGIGMAFTLHASTLSSPQRLPRKTGAKTRFFCFDRLIFALKIGFVLSSFLAPKIAKCCVFNKSLGSFPLFSIFFAFSNRFAPPAGRFRVPFPRSLPALSIGQPRLFV